MNPFLESVIRHALTAAGGVLIMRGYATEGELEIAVGSVIGLVGFGLSIWKNIKAQKKDA